MPRKVEGIVPSQFPDCHAVTFDLYDTLLVTDPNLDHDSTSAEALTEFMRTEGLDTAPSDLHRLMSVPINRDDRRNLTYFELRIESLLQSSGITVDPSRLNRYAQVILDSWSPRWKLAHNALATLVELRVRGKRLALVTNFDHYPYIHELIGRSDLAGLFDCVAVSSEISSDKPDSEIFEYALTRLERSASNAVHVGDGTADIDGARGVGMHPVQIDHYNRDTPQGFRPDVPLLRSLSELLDYIP